MKGLHNSTIQIRILFKPAQMLFLRILRGRPLGTYTTLLVRISKQAVQSTTRLIIPEDEGEEFIFVYHNSRVSPGKCQIQATSLLYP